ncbi:MAG TPA: hypothetical protein VHI52_05455, partial [Verrucomicrobiae bacterium]|nr:hypothetical protein [Verrucomicrobiae bacterium]
MNDQDGAELARLKIRQAKLERDLQELSAHLHRFEERTATAQDQELRAVSAKATEFTPKPAAAPSIPASLPVQTTVPPVRPPENIPSPAVPPLIRPVAEAQVQKVVASQGGKPAGTQPPPAPASPKPERMGEAPALQPL